MDVAGTVSVANWVKSGSVSILLFSNLKNLKFPNLAVGSVRIPADTRSTHIILSEG